MQNEKGRRQGRVGGVVYSALSSMEAPFRSAATSEIAPFMRSISLATEPPSSTAAVAFVSPWPLVGADVVGVSGAEGLDSSASRRSTSALALAMF